MRASRSSIRPVRCQLRLLQLPQRQPRLPLRLPPLLRPYYRSRLGRFANRDGSTRTTTYFPAYGYAILADGLRFPLLPVRRPRTCRHR